MPVVIEMRRRGIRIDQDAAEQARDLLLGKRDAALAELSKELGTAVSMAEINRSQMESGRPSTAMASVIRKQRKVIRRLPAAAANRDG